MREKSQYKKDDTIWVWRKVDLFTWSYNLGICTYYMVNRWNAKGCNHAESAFSKSVKM